MADSVDDEQYAKFANSVRQELFVLRVKNFKIGLVSVSAKCLGPQGLVYIPDAGLLPLYLKVTYFGVNAKATKDYRPIAYISPYNAGLTSEGSEDTVTKNNENRLFQPPHCRLTPPLYQ